MKITRIVYYCTYARSPDELPHYSHPFLTVEEARDEALALSNAGYYGEIEKHHQFGHDDEPNSTWRVDWESAGDDAITLVDEF